MKTTELTGAALDWAVAKCEGLIAFGYKKINDDCIIKLSTGEFEKFAPSTDWALGGAIIAREGIGVYMSHYVSKGAWSAHCPVQGSLMACVDNQPSPLIAAMRSYVASKMGDEVEIPNDIYNNFEVQA